MPGRNLKQQPCNFTDSEITASAWSAGIWSLFLISVLIRLSLENILSASVLLVGNANTCNAKVAKFLN
ncbi:hypothetical protein E2C01_097127 [Portunus trituberculatus]|uniref:Uncharacterized protein n=1 Tax=Portunus trituberculatus TaxID=210409 RepID=A0A5B7JZM5_PORTR|nr:hypothetical protein [Portunus trituberculatus]